MTNQRSLTKGVIFIILTFLSSTLVGACGKGATQYVSAFTLVFFQNIICFLLNLPISLKKGLKTHHPYLHLVRSLSGFLCIYCFFLAVTFIPLANTMLLQNTAPLWVPFIIWIWLKQKVPNHFWWPILIGFIGIILILKPGRAVFDLMTAIALSSGILLGISWIAIRKLAEKEPVSRALFYFFLLSAILAFPLSISDLPAAFSWKPLLLLLGTGVFFYVGNVFLTLAFKYASVSTLSPFCYLAVPFSAIFDWIFWAHVPDLISIIGMVLVIIGGIFSILLEKKYEKKYI